MLEVNWGKIGLDNLSIVFRQGRSEIVCDMLVKSIAGSLITRFEETAGFTPRKEVSGQRTPRLIMRLTEFLDS